jgi:hypothetical protein
VTRAFPIMAASSPAHTPSPFLIYPCQVYKGSVKYPAGAIRNTPARFSYRVRHLLCCTAKGAGLGFCRRKEKCASARAGMAAIGPGEDGTR